ncbi:MAG: hypothetical protein QNJ04_15090 [Desulfobacterales bacterium]|nr:hypothetical protein [Desulfobacterales bacterium]
MKPYLFRVRATPRRHHPQADELAGAYVHVWVLDTDFETARERVAPFLADSHWRIEEWLNEFRITEAQIATLNPSEAANFQRALDAGISADFHSWKTS